MGKGSRQRPYDKKKFEDNWDRIFNKKPVRMKYPSMKESETGGFVAYDEYKELEEKYIKLREISQLVVDEALSNEYIDRMPSYAFRKAVNDLAALLESE